MESNKEMNGDKLKKFISSNKKNIIIVSTIAVILAGAVGGYTLSVKNKVKLWENKIYTGVHAYGTDLTGMNKEEAMDKLQGELLDKIKNKNVVVTVGDKKFELAYSNIGLVFDAEKAVDEALAYGKNFSLFKKNSTISKGKSYSVTADLKHDENAVSQFADEINQAVRVDARNASMTVSGGNIVVTPEAAGMQIDVDDLVSKINASISPELDEAENISIELQEYTPDIKAEDLATIDGVLGSYISSFNNNGDGRAHNVILATDYVNGTIIMPGEEFSYNQTIGETTAERGYKEANTYVGSEVVPGYGGGVCQVSTALYRAVMSSNIRSTVRYNHSMMVSYSEAGLDATVAEGDIDYRFVNTYDTPIYIEGYVSGGSIVFNVYGAKSCLEGKTYDMVSEIVDKYDYSTDYIQDSTLQAGKEVVKMNGALGYKSNSYLVAYENGVEVSRELISTDYYAPLNRVVRKGTKKTA